MVEQGQIIMLDNAKEYICVQNIVRENENILYLVSNFKPVEVKFAKQYLDKKEGVIELINKKEEKIEILKLFKEHEEVNNVR